MSDTTNPPATLRDVVRQMLVAQRRAILQMLRTAEKQLADVDLMLAELDRGAGK
jgi:hypothetical protein